MNEALGKGVTAHEQPAGQFSMNGGEQTKRKPIKKQHTTPRIFECFLQYKPLSIHTVGWVRNATQQYFNKL